jgi:hypothetical protein
MSIISGDRHLRREPSGRLVAAPVRAATVLVRAGAAYAATPAGQHLLHMTVNLLARQFGVVGRILIDVPATSLLDRVVLGVEGGEDLADALMTVVTRIGGREIAPVRGARAERPDIAVLIGPNLRPDQYPCAAVAVVADGWRAACSSSNSMPATAATSRNPVGPYVAACLATGFVFKRLFGRPDGIEFSASLWDWRPGPWDGLAIGAEPDSLQLPDAYLLGNGAVGAALAYTLAATPGLRGRLIAVDPQEMASTDRNRLISGSYDDVGRLKVDLIQRLAEATTIQVYPVAGRWPDDYVTNARRQVPNDITTRENQGQFEWILSCVDRNRDRRGIATYLPRHVIAGSTDGLVAQATYYSMLGRCECLGCNHPALAPDVLEDLVPKLQNLTRAERGAWLQRHGADLHVAAAIDEYLDAPECGGLGEAELARLGREGEVDWSVGFVSVAAGVLQAAAFTQTVQRGIEEAFGSRSERRLLFWNAELVASAVLRRVDCSVCSSTQMREHWVELWGASESRCASIE